MSNYTLVVFIEFDTSKVCGRASALFNTASECAASTILLMRAKINFGGLESSKEILEYKCINKGFSLSVGHSFIAKMSLLNLWAFMCIFRDFIT